MTTVKICQNGLEAKKIIDELAAEGYSHDNIYIFAHGEEREKDLTDAIDTASVGLGEKGIMDTVKNVFRKRGDELRAEFQAVGLSKEDADKYEKVLDGGELVLVAKK